MFISQINSAQNKSYINFRGNSNPKAVQEKCAEVIRELDIETGTSFIVQEIKKQKPEVQKVWENFFDTIKKNIPLADTVEKLELLKTYVISLLDNKSEDLNIFLRFLKSKKATDRNVFFLQQVMNIVKSDRERAFRYGIPFWQLEDYYAKVLRFVLGKSKAVYFSTERNQEEIKLDNRLQEIKSLHEIYERLKLNGNKELSNNLLNSMLMNYSSQLPIPVEDVEYTFGIVDQIISKGLKEWLWDDMKSHNTMKDDIFSYKINSKNSFLSVGAEWVDFYRNDCCRNEIEVTIGHSPNRWNLSYYSKNIEPVYRQFFLRLDKDRNLLKVKFNNYIKNPDFKENIDDYKHDYEYLYTPDARLSHVDSPFEKCPNWLSKQMPPNKYIVESVEYDPKTEIATYKGKKYKRIEVPAKTKGALGSGDKKFSFEPLEPTIYELGFMINRENRNNLLTVLECSDWKNAFVKVIEDKKV